MSNDCGWRRIEKIKWVDEVSNKYIERIVDEDKSMLITVGNLTGLIRTSVADLVSK